MGRKVEKELGRLLREGDTSRLSKFIQVGEFSRLWQEAEALSIRELVPLIALLSRIPLSMEFPLMAADSLHNSLLRVLEFSKSSPECLLRAVEMVLGAIERLMQMSWGNSERELCEALKDCISCCSNCLIVRHADHREAKNRAIEILNRLNARVTVRSETTDDETEEDEEDEEDEKQQAELESLVGFQGPAYVPWNPTRLSERRTQSQTECEDSSQTNSQGRNDSTNVDQKIHGQTSTLNAEGITMKKGCDAPSEVNDGMSCKSNSALTVQIDGVQYIVAVAADGSSVAIRAPHVEISNSNKVDMVVPGLVESSIKVEVQIGAVSCTFAGSAADGSRRMPATPTHDVSKRVEAGDEGVEPLISGSAGKGVKVDPSEPDHRVFKKSTEGGSRHTDKDRDPDDNMPVLASSNVKVSKSAEAGDMKDMPLLTASNDPGELHSRSDKNDPSACTWDGCKLLLSESELAAEMKENEVRYLEKELINKLNFVPEKLKNYSARSAFGGIKLLDKLSSLCNVAESPLLRCLELLHLGWDVDECSKHLQEYVASLRFTSSGAHPLQLLAEARLLSPSEENLSKRKELLQTFTSTYGKEATNPWLRRSERSDLCEEEVNPCESLCDAASSQRIEKLHDYEKEWRKLKIEEGCTSPAMEELLGLVGISKVKNAAILIFRLGITLSKLDEKVREENKMGFNYLFYGNPGTGKTTVARLLGRILKDAGVRRSKNFVERTAQEVKKGGVEQFQKDVDELAKNGLLFIDEAYDLDPGKDQRGHEIVMQLLTDAENKRDKISFILAGYEDKMEKKLLSFNEGVKSRFQEIYFEDFEEHELGIIFQREIERRSISASEEVERVLVKRLARQSNYEGFGNARAVRVAVDKAFQLALLRHECTGTLVKIITTDVIGEHPFHNPKLQRIMREIDSKTGWKRIKKSLHELVKLCAENYDREIEGQAPLPFQMNRLFLGNPGTGKTTCARLYGRMLRELGFLSNGEVVMRGVSDLMGQYIGESVQKTKAVIESAKGKVLVIDEAYGLNDKWYGKQVLDTIVDKVQGRETDDIAVVLVGYEKQMNEMLQSQNPGLARRFGRDYAFYFDDYSVLELLEIFRSYCSSHEVIPESVGVADAAMKILEGQKAFTNFGNAGAVELLVKKAIAKAGMRSHIKDEAGRLVLLEGDFDHVQDEDDTFAQLNGLYRIENIRRALEDIRNSFTVAEAEGSEPPKLGHFVFTGPPGTGKTTVARAMAKILHKLRILACDKLVETSGLNLTGEYLGQTKTRVKSQLDEAKGGILFIDEAYELGKGYYGEEAMTSLVAAMTSDEYKGVSVIIVGYPKEIEDMLDRNAGLKSRFTRFFEFLAWDAKDCSKVFSSWADSQSYILSTEVAQCLRDGFEELVEYPGWGNGRDVKKIWEFCLEARSERIMGGEPETIKTLMIEDVEKNLEKCGDLMRPVMR